MLASATNVRDMSEERRNTWLGTVWRGITRTREDGGRRRLRTRNDLVSCEVACASEVRSVTPLR